MLPRSLLLVILLWSWSSLSGADEKYTGPHPPKPDIPYLMHADNLVEPESLVEPGNEIHSDG